MVCYDEAVWYAFRLGVQGGAKTVVYFVLMSLFVCNLSFKKQQQKEKSPHVSSESQTAKRREFAAFKHLSTNMQLGIQLEFRPSLHFQELYHAPCCPADGIRRTLAPGLSVQTVQATVTRPG